MIEGVIGEADFGAVRIMARGEPRGLNGDIESSLAPGLGPELRVVEPDLPLCLVGEYVTDRLSHGAASGMGIARSLASMA